MENNDQTTKQVHTNASYSTTGKQKLNRKIRKTNAYNLR